MLLCLLRRMKILYFICEITFRPIESIDSFQKPSKMNELVTFFKENHVNNSGVI